MKSKVIFILLMMFACVATSGSAQTCRYCKGTGKMIHEGSVSTYGSDRLVWCDICNKYNWASTGHKHIYCQYCRGTGKGKDYSSGSSSSSSSSSKPSDDFLASYLTYEEMEQLKIWSKCLYTGYPYEGTCPSCNGKRTCNWCHGSGYIRAGFGGRYVQVMCTHCYNGVCKNCAGLGYTTQYSKRPEHMKIVNDKINELYEIAKRRSYSNY